MRLYSRSILILLVIFSLGLGGCQPKPSTATVVPTINIQQATPTAVNAATAYPPQAGEATSTGYPAPDGQPTAYPYPGQGGPGPAGVQVVENRAKVTARLISQSADEKNAGMVKLHVEVLTSVKVMGPDFAAKLVNQEADLYAQAADLPALKEGDTFEAEVSYNGDERGGRYNATQIKKLE